MDSVRGLHGPDQGHFSQKVWYATGSTVDRVGGLAVWVPFGRVAGQLPYSDFLLLYTRWFEFLVDEDPAVGREVASRSYSRSWLEPQPRPRRQPQLGSLPALSL